MYKHRATLNISNSRDKPHLVAVEPWGEDFTLMPGEEFELVAQGNLALPTFHIVELDGASQVFCNDTTEFEVFQAGNRLECGHNRKPDSGA